MDYDKIIVEIEAIAIEIKQWVEVIVATQIPHVNKVDLALNNITAQEMWVADKDKPTHQYKAEEYIEGEVVDIKIVIETIVSVYRE